MDRYGHFKPASDLLRAKIREIGEGRGFSATRLLTHWSEIVGEAVAVIARPLEVRHPRGKGAAEGATLTVLALGAAALRLEMEKERIRERVNACYGYGAIAKIRIRQAGPETFAKAGGAVTAPTSAPDLAASDAAEPLVAEVSNTELRLALAALAAKVLSKSRP